MGKLLNSMAIAASTACLVMTGAQAAHVNFKAELIELNDSGASGTARFSYNAEENTLRVRVNVVGLDEGLHPMHIHGRFSDGLDGEPIDSVAPLPEAEFDTDNDGVLTVAEGAPAYGPVILPLTTSGGASGGFPMGTSIDYDRTFDFDIEDAGSFFATIGDSDDRYDVADLLPLMLREIVVHGVNEDGTYIPSLPALAGEISAVPVPAAAFLFAGTGLAAGFGRRLAKRRS
jgi:hypothetical protein